MEGHSSGWYSLLYGYLPISSEVTIYKTGSVKYWSTETGEWKECTRGFYWSTETGEWKKLRYIQVFDENGTRRIIDMYTAKY